MPLRVKPIRDLERVGQTDPGGTMRWQSTGEDPGLLVSLGPLRRRYLLIYLESEGPTLDPQIYISYGRGFHERNTLTPLRSERQLILLDVGVIGTVRSVRLDPATFPVRFACRIEACANREQALQRARDWGEGPSLKLQTYGKLNRLWMPGRRLPFTGSAVAKHSRQIYELAAQATQAVRHSGKDVWLSVIVPVYNALPRHLDDLLAAFRSQDIAGAEIVFSDDASSAKETLAWLQAHRREPGVRIVLASRNGGIAAATNAGLSAATGTWVALMDHDDLFAPHALKVIRKALDAAPKAQFAYTDELVVDDRLQPTGYMLKPAYDPVLLTGVNYINHLSLYRRRRLEAVGGLREGFDGSQDYDLLLRYLDGIAEDAVLHIPYPAYWWRRHGQSFSRKYMERATHNARRALAEAMSSRGLPAEVAPALTPTLHRIDFKPDRHAAKVSIIIPNKNAYNLIDRVLSDIYSRTDYQDFEVLVIDNGTTDRRVLELYERMGAAHRNFAAYVKAEPFNYARAVNRGFARASGQHFLLLNNDIEVISPGWLSEMVGCLAFDKAGIVGAKLLFPDDTIQHAGVITGFGGLAGHWYINKPRDFGGPMNRLHVRGSMTCVTGAAMLISDACRAAVGNLDESNFAVAYNDVDYCLRAYGLGFRTVWTPFACLYHHESASRGSDHSMVNRVRFEVEKGNLRRIHRTTDFIDPASHPFYQRNHSTPSLDRPTGLFGPRGWFPRQE